MRSERFLDLYISETREHHRLLVGSLLRLESGDRDAIESAFRAAHTLKGLAAAMGHSAAAALAHSLEDQLSTVRQQAADIRPEMADRLLEAADAVEAVIAEAIANPSAVASAAPAPAGATDGAVRAVSPAARDGVKANTPGGTKHVIVVTLAPDTPMPEARAEIMRRAAARAGNVLGMDPPDSAGEFRLYLADGADPAAVEEAIRRAGDVQGVRVTSPASPRPSRASAAMAEPVPSSVRVDRARLDELAEGIAELAVLHARAADEAEAWRSDRAGAVLSALQRAVLELRMVPVSIAFERLARVVRDAARLLGKEVDFQLAGGDIELDQAVLDALVDPLMHLLRNAVDHAIERPAERETAGKPRRGSIRLEVLRERSSVRLVVSDDGRGVNRRAVAARAHEAGLLPEPRELSDEEVFRFLIQPGFSTAEQVTELSGRGVGMDVVAARIRSLGGAIEMTTTEGAGTTFTLRVPVTLALAHALRIRVGGEDYAMPLTNISEVILLDGDGAQRPGAVRVRGDLVPLVNLGDVLGAPAGRPVAAVVAELGGRRVALAVDQVVGHEQIVVKSFDAPIGTLPVFSGATLLPDGRPALLIDPLSVL